MSEKKVGNNLKDRLKGTVDTLKSSVKDIKVPEILKKKETDSGGQSFSVSGILSTKCALQIIYYLMSVDGQITPDEEERYKELGGGLDPDFNMNNQLVTDECRLQIAKVIDPEDLYEVVREGVEKAIDNSVATEDSFITPRLLLWDLLTIAHADNNYDEVEKELIKFIVRKLGIYKAVFLEMESTLLALEDIEKEIEWIKTTNRPYLVIEGMVNELEDRKQVLFSGVKDLITL